MPYIINIFGIYELRCWGFYNILDLFEFGVGTRHVTVQLVGNLLLHIIIKLIGS